MKQFQVITTITGGNREEREKLAWQIRLKIDEEVQLLGHLRPVEVHTEIVPEKENRPKLWTTGLDPGAWCDQPILWGTDTLADKADVIEKWTQLDTGTTRVDTPVTKRPWWRFW